MKSAIFIINLLQDVNVLRPLVFLASKDLGFNTEFLVTAKFVERDKSGLWLREIYQIAQQTQSLVYRFEKSYQAVQVLNNKHGFLIAGSESNLGAHSPTHQLFLCAPKNFTRVTLQHGFECVGFRQSREHDKAHGTNVSFGADIVCGWYDTKHMSSLLPSQRHKLLVTGPSQVLQIPNVQPVNKLGRGLVCENLHSVRLSASGDFKMSFIDTFTDFCRRQESNGQQVTLRPHPGGQYVVKNNVMLPNNVELNNQPMYKLDLRQYSYGISAPSSVLIDMVLAGIPTAVWRDSGSLMDADNYSGLTAISSVEDWLAFADRANKEPEYFIERQNEFLSELDMPHQASQVHSGFVRLFSSFQNNTNVQGLQTDLSKGAAIKPKVVFIANDYVPTLQLSFIKPLANLKSNNDIDFEFISEVHLREQFGVNLEEADVTYWLERRLNSFQPTTIVFCRYSGPQYFNVVNWAKRNNVTTIYHIDDDLLTIPKDIGEKKYRHHNQQDRLSSVYYLLNNTDLVYCSTVKLKARLTELGVKSPVENGDIYCSGSLIKLAEDKPTQKIGYMASADHAHNLDVVLPALIDILAKYPDVEVEFFGSIPVPEKLKVYSTRVNVSPPVKNYNNFLQEFSKRNWDIGICPLTPIHFNMMKANTKWVEYSSVGAAVVASKGTVYDECCSDDCGLLASSTQEWLEHLSHLIENPKARFDMVKNAQMKLQHTYSLKKLEQQVLGMLNKADNYRVGIDE